MIKKCVLLDGKIINIGDWDDMNGENPMPEGAVVEERDFGYDADRGWHEVGAEVYAQIEALKADLEQTDYKIIKCSEYQLAGQSLPYDIQALHAERQALRDNINALELTLS